MRLIKLFHRHVHSLQGVLKTRDGSQLRTKDKGGVLNSTNTAVQTNLQLHQDNLVVERHMVAGNLPKMQSAKT